MRFLAFALMAFLSGCAHNKHVGLVIQGGSQAADLQDWHNVAPDPCAASETSAIKPCLESLRPQESTEASSTSSTTTFSYSLDDIGKVAKTIHTCGRAQGMAEVLARIGPASLAAEAREVSEDESCKAVRKLMDMLDALKRDAE